MSEATPVEPLKTQEESEASSAQASENPRGGGRTPAEEGGEEEKEGREEREAPAEPDRDHSLGLPRVVGQHGVRDVPLEPCQ